MQLTHFLFSNPIFVLQTSMDGWVVFRFMLWHPATEANESTTGGAVPVLAIYATCYNAFAHDPKQTTTNMDA